MTKIKILIVVALFATVGSLFKYVDHLNSKLDTANQTIVSLNNDIERLSDEKIYLNNSYISTQKQLRATLSKYQTAAAKLDTMKDREQVLIKKPVLVEKLINKSFASFEEELQCVTSGRSSC